MTNRLSATYLYVLDSEAPLRNGFVEYDSDGVITAVGICDDPSAEPDFRDGAIVPGFVNAHCHIELSHLYGRFRKGTGMAGFIDQINEMRDSASREDRVAALSLRMNDLWRQGVSAMADISNCDESFAAKASSPMYVRTFLEVFGTEPQDCDGVIASVRELKKKAEEWGLDAAPSPHSCYTMSPQLLTAASAEALKAGWLSYHSQESPEEEEMLKYGSGALYDNRRRAGMSTPPVTGKSSLMYFIDRLEAVHSAPFDEHILLVHNVCLDEESADVALSVMNNVYWALCPLSNLFIHDALPPVRMMRKKGLKLTVGTDSLSSNDTLDMVREMHCLQTSFPELSLGEMLIWACRNGADFLAKRDRLGTLEPGKCPGIVLVKGLDRNGRLTDESCSERII